MKKQDIKPFAWGLGVGAVVLLIVIFSAGWVVTSGSAEDKAEAMAKGAVMNRLAPIAVAQFMLDPNKEDRLNELKELKTYGENSRSKYVQKQGWATMPGEKDPDVQVADEAVKRLMDLKI
jgi:hypothetical protein